MNYYGDDEEEQRVQRAVVEENLGSGVGQDWDSEGPRGL